MKKLFASLIIFLLFVPLFTNTAAAQTVTDKQVALRWNLGQEPDIALYRVYLLNEATQTYEVIDTVQVNPNDPATPQVLQSTYQLQVPAGENVTRWFTVSAVDTSGNESDFATPVSVTVDNEAPAPPTGLVIEVLIQVVQ